MLQVLQMKDIVGAFDLASVHKSGAIVSIDRLAWINKQHVRAGLSSVEGDGVGDAKLHAKAKSLLMDAFGFNLTPANIAAAISLVRSRLNVLADIVAESRFLFEEPVLKVPLSTHDAEIVRQFVAVLQEKADTMNFEYTNPQLQHGIDAWPDTASAAICTAAIDAVRLATKLKPPNLFPPIRLALTVQSSLIFPLLFHIFQHNSFAREKLMVCPSLTLCQD
jgi:glutamyl/glutaminyl-tRNA synthetase